MDDLDLALSFAERVEPALAEAEAIARDLAVVIADDSIPAVDRLALAETTLAELLEMATAFAERASDLKTACQALITGARGGIN